MGKVNTPSTAAYSPTTAAGAVTLMVEDVEPSSYVLATVMALLETPGEPMT